MTRIHNKAGAWAILLIAFALMAAACAQPTGEPGVTTAPPTETTAPPTETTAAAEGQIYLMSADGSISATFFENVTDQGLGMYFSAPGQPDTADYEDFLTNYEELVGTPPVQAFHARAYDSVFMVKQAIEAVAEDPGDGSLVIDRVALIEAMYQVDYTGLTGQQACNQFGDCAAPIISIHLYADAAAGLQGVVDNVVSTSSFDMPGAGIGEVPEAPGDFGAVTVPADAPIQIATAQTISGATINLGQDQVDGIRVAIEDINAEGGVLGHELELAQVEDELCAAEGGQTAAQSILANPDIVAVIGTSCSGAGVPMADALTDQGILMLSASNTSPFLTATGYFSEEGPQQAENWHWGYFRNAHNDEFQGRAAATFALEELGVTQAATIHDGDPYTSGLAGAFGASFEEFGGTVVLATSVTPDQEDMRPVLTEVAASGAEIVFFPIFEPASPRIVLQIRDVGLEPIPPMSQ
ncbi:MAG: ABC transporter substrate-binding protein [Actinomycetota bacterium]